MLSSSTYLQLVKSISNDADVSANEILELLKKKPSTNDDRLQDASFSAHSTNTLESWGSLVSGISPGSDDLKVIANQLHPNQSLSVRIQGAQALESFSVGDLLSDEFWQDSKQIMQLALTDVDTQISAIGLQVYARAFKIAPTYLVSDVFLSYIRQIHQMLTIDPKLKLIDGLDTCNTSIQSRIKQVDDSN